MPRARPKGARACARGRIPRLGGEKKKHLVQVLNLILKVYLGGGGGVITGEKNVRRTEVPTSILRIHFSDGWG